MKTNQSILLLFLLISFASCKTQEDIRREKSVESLNEQVAITQKNTASASARFLSIEEQLSKLSGQSEELAHNRQQEIRDFAMFNERLNTLEEANKKQIEYIKTLNEKIQDQTAYIDQVIKSLNSLVDKKKDLKTEKLPVTVKSGISQFKSRDYDSSKATFLEILNNKKVSQKNKEASLHYLGQIEFQNKNYEESKVYFSKLFSENPKSIYGSRALLGLAKSFLQLKAKDEASQTIDEIIARYPKTKESNEALKMKAKL